LQASLNIALLKGFEHHGGEISHGIPGSGIETTRPNLVDCLGQQCSHVIDAPELHLRKIRILRKPAIRLATLPT
jgi:hypothetical protein